MGKRLVRVAIIAVGLLLAALLVPDIEVDWSGDTAGTLFTLLALALAFGVVNALIRPIAHLASMPVNVATLGMFSVVVNASLLLLVAFLVDLTIGRLIVIGGYPPDLGIEAIAAAAIGSFIISAIATVLTILIPET